MDGLVDGWMVARIDIWMDEWVLFSTFLEIYKCALELYVEN